MADRLVIVESPSKAVTIHKYLGKNTKVMASIGHIRDLPKSTLAIDIEHDFEPKYINIRGKGDLIKDLKKEAKKAKKIYLATDPDREGEAIAWHLAYILSDYKDKIKRVTFNEITQDAVKEAMKHPREIDMDIVDAQQARRVLDRIVGYKMSPLLWKKVKAGLSAGRVQSVALKIIVDRENDIRQFVPKEYWNLDVILQNKDKKEIEASFYGKEENGKEQKLELNNKEEVDNILEDIKKKDFVVDSIKDGQKRRSPSPPFTTSTMQQEANKKLNFSLKRTMQTAQNLYEGVKIPEHGQVGLITYMRTDSTRIADVAKQAAKTEILNMYGDKYYQDRTYKVAKDAQDGHEAIRPTYINIKPEDIKDNLTLDQYKLYRLIYNRFLQSQMTDAVFDTKAVKIKNGEYIFKASAQTLKFQGFLVLDKDKEKNTKLESLEEQEKLKLKKEDPKQSFTQPPARFTEASLVKILEEKEIGRPSTYSPTITTLMNRYYVKKEQKQLVPTELGEIVNKLLIENFSDVINEEFTAQMETQMDEIASGNMRWKKLIEEFYGPFSKELEVVEKQLEHVELTYEQSDVKCEKCGRTMVYKYGKYGKFLACPGFPECKNAKPILKYIDIPCPNCGARVIEKKSARNRTFYVCEHNVYSEDEINEDGTSKICPICNYISWDKPKVGDKWDPEKAEELKKEYELSKITKKKKAQMKIKTKTKAKTKKKASKK